MTSKAAQIAAHEILESLEFHLNTRITGKMGGNGKSRRDSLQEIIASKIMHAEYVDNRRMASV